jgi:hypothetical protein
MELMQHLSSRQANKICPQRMLIPNSENSWLAEGFSVSLFPSPTYKNSTELKSAFLLLKSETNFSARHTKKFPLGQFSLAQ